MAVVLKNRSAFPRGFLLEAADEERLKGQLLNGHWPPLNELKIPDPAWQVLRGHSPVQIEKRPNGYRIVYRTSEPAFIFLSEMFHPAWEAVAAGKPVSVVSPFGVFMGVFVPPGRHDVIFRYRPVHLYACWGISIGALFLALAGLVLVRRGGG